MTTAIAKRDEQQRQIRDFLTDEKQLAKLTDALPPGVSAENLVRVFLNSLVDNEKLLEASIGNQASLWGALVESATLGLICGGPMAQGYLIPYQVKGKAKVSFQIGYRGVIELVQRTGQLRKIVAVDVREGDKFETSDDPLDDSPLIHKPVKSHDRHKRNITHVWAGAVMQDGTRHYISRTKAEIDAHKEKYSRAWKLAQDRGKDSPWDEDKDWLSMAKKTLLLMLIREHHLPIALDDQRQQQYMPEPVAEIPAAGEITAEEITDEEDWAMFQNYAAERMAQAVGILDVDGIVESLNSEYQGEAHAKYIFELAETKRAAIRGSRGENSKAADVGSG